MRTDLKGVHMDVTEKVKEYLEKRLLKIDFAKEIIIDLPFTFTRENNAFTIESTIHFRWGNSAHISVNSFDIYEGIDSLIDKVEQKIIREKEKIQQHNG